MLYVGISYGHRSNMVLILRAYRITAVAFQLGAFESTVFAFPRESASS